VSSEVEGLFTLLARSLHSANPAFVTQPLEVAELPARWIPYALVRRELGVPTNEDYELLLMRLISGESGLIFADEALQDDLRREAASINPDLTALRTYGAARITLAREAVRRVLELSDEALPAPPPVVPPPRPSAPAAPAAPDPTALAPAPRVALKVSCQYCGHELPTGREVHFCPACGLNVRALRCAGCSSELEPTWRFCVTCGRAVHASSP
jgi:hypothetical protein